MFGCIGILLILALCAMLAISMTTGMRNGPKVTVHNLQKKEEDLHLPWDEVWRAYRRKNCVYLYASPAKAFLLPSGQADVPDQAVLEALKEKLPSSKLFLF